MTFNGVIAAESAHGRRFLIAGPLNRERATIKKRASLFGKRDQAIDTGLRFLGLHRLLQPAEEAERVEAGRRDDGGAGAERGEQRDRKSTRLNSSHSSVSRMPSSA